MTKPVNATALQLAELNQENWFKYLMEDCQSIIVEHEFTAKWAVIEGYHSLGIRILSEYEKFNRLRMKDDEFIKIIAQGLARSTRTVYYAVKFAREYPSLDALPEGKNINWHSIVNKYLKAKNNKELNAELKIEGKGAVCPNCGWKL